MLDPLNHSVLKANCESASIMLNMLESKWPDFNQNFVQVLACATRAASSCRRFDPSTSLHRYQFPYLILKSPHLCSQTLRNASAASAPPPLSSSGIPPQDRSESPSFAQQDTPSSATSPHVKQRRRKGAAVDELMLEALTDAAGGYLRVMISY